MLANLIILVIAVIGISDGLGDSKPSSSYNEKAGEDRGGWDRN